MQPIDNIIRESNAILESSHDADILALASLVRELSIRLRDVEALAATNEMAISLEETNGKARMAHIVAKPAKLRLGTTTAFI